MHLNSALRTPASNTLCSLCHASTVESLRQLEALLDQAGTNLVVLFCFSKVHSPSLFPFFCLLPRFCTDACCSTLVPLAA